MELVIAIEGGKELLAKLRDLEEKVADHHVATAIKAGCQPILDGAKANAPVRTGALRDAIKVRPVRNKGGYASAVVGVGQKWFVGDQYYAAFVEFGHRVGRRLKKWALKHLGDHRKEVPGEHFIEYAFDEKKEDALDTMMETLEELIENEGSRK